MNKIFKESGKFWLLGLAPSLCFANLDYNMKDYLNSDQHKKFVLKNSYIYKGLKKFEAHDPFELNFQIYRETNKQTNEPSYKEVKTISQNKDIEFKYKNRNGINIETKYQIANQVYNGDFFNDKENESRTTSLTISYDILKDGTFQFQQKQAKSNILLKKSELYENKDSSLQEKMRFINHIIDYNTLRCKMINVTYFDRKISEILSKAKSRLKAKSISYRNYLNYLSIKNNISVQKQLLQTQTKRAISKIRNYITQEIKFSQKSCNYKIPPLKDVNVKKHPSIQRLRLLEQGFNEKSEVIKIAQKPAVNTFYTYSYNSDELLNNSKTDNRVGISFTWKIPEKSQNNEYAEAFYQKQYYEKLANIRYKTLQNLVDQEQTNISENKFLLKELNQLITDNEKLLKSLELEAQIGKDDSLNYANTMTNLISQKNQELDIISTIHKSHAQLDYLKSI